MGRLLGIVAGGLLELVAISHELPWLLLDRLIAWHERRDQAAF